MQHVRHRAGPAVAPPQADGPAPSTPAAARPTVRLAPLPPPRLRFETQILVFALGFAATFGLIAWCAQDSTFWFLVVVSFATPILVVLACLIPLVRRWLPVVVTRRFAAYADDISRQSKKPIPLEQQIFATTAPFSVGMRTVRGDGRPSRHRPHGTLFYPTDESDLDARVPFLPYGGDYRYGSGTMAYQGLPSSVAANLASCAIAAVQNARPAATLKLDDFDGCTLGSAAHPLLVFSHGMSGHQHQYFSFVADLVAAGAIVFVLEHTDGSAAFSRRPPAAATCQVGDGDGVPFFVSRVPSSPTSEVMLRFSMMYQIRVPEIKAAVEFLRTGGAHAVLLSEAPEAALRFMMQCTIQPPPVSLVGHSFGGATVAATALQLAEEGRGDHVSAVVAFDMWHVPTEGLPLLAREVARRAAPLLLIDSEEWHREAASRRRNSALRAEWGRHAQRVWTQGTDHLTLTDAAYQFRAPFVRKWYRTQDDRLQTALWGSKTMDEIRRQLHRRSAGVSPYSATTSPEGSGSADAPPAAAD